MPPPLGICDGKQNKTEIEREWSQILAIFIGSLTAFTDGAIFAWTSPFMVKLEQDKDLYDISEVEASYIPAIQPVTWFITCLLTVNLSNIFGRKKVLLFISVPQVLCLVISALARSIYVFYVARAISGVGAALMWTVLPMYIGEVASPKVRGVWGNALSLAFFSGQFFINIIGGFCNVDTTSYIFLPFPILFFVLFHFIPETPYYCIMKKDYEAAKKSLRFLYRVTDVEDRFQEIKNAVERQMSEPGRWKDMININSNRKALYVGIFLRISQQLGGVSIFNLYTQYIFSKAGGNVSAHDSSMIITGTMVFLNILVVTFIIDRFSRKTLYALSLCICSLTLFVMSIYFYFDEMVASSDMSSFNWLPLVTILFYQIAASFGLSIIPTLMTSELFSASVKAKAVSILTSVLAAGIFLMSNLFTLLNYWFGTYVSFLLLAIATFVSTILSLFLIPETKGKTLEEIQIALKGKILK